MDIRDQMDVGGSRYDTTRAMSDPSTRKRIINSLTPEEEVDVVVALETLGLPIGLLIAENCDAGFVPLREENKIPASEKHLRSVDVPYDHRDKTLVVDARNLSDDQEVLLADDWIESGEQIRSALNLVEPLCDEITAVSTIGTDTNEQYKFLEDYTVLEAID